MPLTIEEVLASKESRKGQTLFDAAIQNAKKAQARDRRNRLRRERDQALRDLGLVKVRGALGGVYWE